MTGLGSLGVGLSAGCIFSGILARLVLLVLCYSSYSLLRFAAKTMAKRFGLVRLALALGSVALCTAHSHDDNGHSHGGDEDHGDQGGGSEAVYGGIGEAMGASIITMLPTLLGIFMITGVFFKRAGSFKDIPTKSFAAGVVLGTSTFNPVARGLAPHTCRGNGEGDHDAVGHRCDLWLAVRRSF